MRAEDLSNTIYEEAVPDGRATSEDRAALGAPPAGVTPLTGAQLEWVLERVGLARRESAAHAVGHVLGILDGTVTTKWFWGSFRVHYADEPLSTELGAHFSARHASERPR